MPDLPPLPPLMASAIDTAPVVGPETPMERAAYAAQHARETAPSYLSGVLGLGGATGDAARYLGYPGIADWFDKSAAADPTAHAWGSVANPASLFGYLYESGKDVYNAAQTPVPPPVDRHILTKDEFLQSHQNPQQSLAEAVSSARNDFMASPAYKALAENGMATAARKQVKDVEASAAATWQANQQNVAAGRSQIESDYRDYLDDQNKRLFAEHSQSFADRHPALAAAAPAAGGLMSFLLSRGLFNKMAKAGSGVVGDANAALDANRAGDFARNAALASDWEKGLRWKQPTALAAASLVPLEMRTLADVTDKYGLPREYIDANGNVQRARAQETAEDRLNDPLHYMIEGVPALLTGATGSVLGSKFAKTAPVYEARNLSRLPSAAEMQPFSDYKTADALASGIGRTASQNTLASQGAADRLLADTAPVPPVTSPPVRPVPGSDELALPAPKKTAKGKDVSSKAKSKPSQAPLVPPGSRPEAEDEIRGFLSQNPPRPKFADGGNVSADPLTNQSVHLGPLYSHDGGRTDTLPVSVPANSYILPADVVSALGEGNSDAGHKVVEHVFGKPSARHYASGGGVPIIAAGGEHALGPDQVAQAGGGDYEHGHAVIDQWVKNVRKTAIKTLAALPGPAK